MRQVAPVGDLARDVVRDAADREVRIGVGDDDRDLDPRIEFAQTQGRTDAGVTSADGDEMHGAAPSSVETWLLGQIPDTPASLRFLGAICGGKSHVVSRGDPRLGIVRAAEVSEDDVGRLGLGHPGIQQVGSARRPPRRRRSGR